MAEGVTHLIVYHSRYHFQIGPMLLDVAQCVSSVLKVFQKDKAMSKVAQLFKGSNPAP